MQIARVVKINLTVRFAEQMTIKDKRSRVAPIMAKIRSIYNCAALEISGRNASARFDLVYLLSAVNSTDAQGHADKLIEYLNNCFRSDKWIEPSIEWLEERRKHGSWFN